MNRKKFLFLLFFCIFPAAKSNFAQNAKIDSLLRISKITKKDTDRIRILNKIANTYLYQGNYPEALKNYFAALKISEQIGSKKDIAAFFGNIGEIYRLQGNYPGALKNYFAALKIIQENGDKKNTANAYNNIGLIYVSQQNNQEALKNYLMALKIRKEIGDKKGLAESYNNIAIIYDNQSNYSEALKNYLTSLSINKEIKNFRGVAISYINIGELYTLLKKFPEASLYLNKALQLSKGIGYKEIVMETYNALSELNSKLGNWKSAYEYHSLYSLVKDSILNESNNRQIVEMQTKYETEKKEKENAILLQENKIKTLELSDQANKRNIMIGSFAFILLLGGVSYNRYRLKQRNKILMERELRAHAIFQAQEEEKTHISKELHDGVGPLLSLIKLNISSLEVNPANEKIIKSTKELASESIKEVRNISHSLMPSLLIKSGLKSALEEIVEQMNTTETIKVEIGYNLKIKITPETEVNIYRIIQEALNNILKHSGASQANIELREQEKNIEIKIADNGRGFDTEKLSSLSGNGLNNIYSRVDLLKGKITITSKKDQGTQFIIHIPLNQIKNG